MLNRKRAWQVMGLSRLRGLIQSGLDGAPKLGFYERSFDGYARGSKLAE